MSHIGDLDRLRSYQSAFAASIDDVPPDAPVAHCGDWTVSDLVEHLAEVHLWAARRAGAPRHRPAPAPDLRTGYLRAAAALSDALERLDPDQACWTLLDDDVPADVPRVGTVRFWHRRQANETLVHLWDLRTAGDAGLDLPDEEWLDCLDEAVTVMHPRQVRLGRIDSPGVLVAFAVAGGPVLELDGAPEGADRVVVHGTARELALVAWGRWDPASLEVDGNREALAGGLVGIVP
jgi:uncharacterized protein (TIGR03083 family)